MKQEIVIDSDVSFEQAVLQNPEQPYPEDLKKTLRLLKVKYYGFDDRLHQGQIIVNSKVASDIKAFFKHALESNFPIEKVVPVSSTKYHWDANKVLSDNVSSCFDYRPIAGTDKLSLHSYGLAIDINPVQNPYIRYEDDKEIVAPEGAIWNKKLPGTLYAEHALVRLMEGFGWEWGGLWKPESGRTDYQHFQKDIP